MSQEEERQEWSKGMRYISLTRQEILKFLRERYPRTVSASEVAEHVPVKSANARYHLSDMYKRELIDCPARGLYKAKPEVMP